MKLNMERIALPVMIAGAALIVAGVLLGGYRSIWQKAAIICLECIGLGS